MHKPLPRAEVLQKVPPPSSFTIPPGDTAHVRVSCSKDLLLGEHPIEKSLSQLTTGQRHSTAAVPRARGRKTQAECSGAYDVNPLHSSPPITQHFMLMAEFPRSIHCPNKVSFLLQELQ